jgi:Ca2+-binding EF-hand superfamily protein
MKGFRKIALVAISATMLGTLAGPAFADRGDKDRGDGHGWRHEQMHGKAKWGGKRRHGHHGRHGGRMAMMFMEVFDTDGDGKLTQDEIDARRDELFAAADVDGDGRVTLEEFKVAYAETIVTPKVRAFQRMDRDGDGKVSEEDFNRRAERMLSRMERRKGDGHGPRHGGMRPGMEEHDTDADGRLSADEIRAARADRFAKADADGDKVLTLEEFGTIWNARMDRHMVRMFQRLDRDGDLAITAEEAARPTRNLVTRMDRDGDGALTLKDRKGRGKGKGGHDWHGKRGGPDKRGGHDRRGGPDKD